VGDSEASIKYLAPYVFRVAISDHRIVKVENGRVFFRYRHQKSNRERTMALDALEFLRRFLQHVLPSGFMKVRYFGFMSPNAAVSLEEVRAKIELAYGFDVPVPQYEPKPKPGLICRGCGSLVRFLFLMLPPQRRPQEPSG
jgi:nucleoside-diphosphate-sugar epimerase